MPKSKKQYRLCVERTEEFLITASTPEKAIKKYNDGDMHPDIKCVTPLDQADAHLEITNVDGTPCDGRKPAPLQMDDIDAMLESAIANLASIYGKATPCTDYQDAVSALDKLNEIKRVRQGKSFVDEKEFKKQAKYLLKWLNCLDRKPGAPAMTLADLCDRHEAVGLMDGEKDLHGWEEGAVFIRVESLKRHIRNLTPEGYEWLTTPEKIMGWFEEQNDDECDAEGEFMSTPCWNEEMDEETDLEDDILCYLDYCSRGGLLLIR
jgi:hypothetical protein